VLLVLACFVPLALLAGRGQPWAWQAALVDAPTSALG